jgi:hypothetical protein
VTAILTEIAIQMKGSLSFLLGLGGLFSIAKSGVTSWLGLPELPEGARASVSLAVQKLRRELLAICVATLVLFVAACWIYFVPLAGLDDKALASGKQTLTVAQEWAVGIIVLAAVVMVVLDAVAGIRRQRVSDLVKL